MKVRKVWSTCINEAGHRLHKKIKWPRSIIIKFVLYRYRYSSCCRLQLCILHDNDNHSLNSCLRKYVHNRRCLKCIRLYLWTKMKQNSVETISFEWLTLWPLRTFARKFSNVKFFLKIYHWKMTSEWCQNLKKWRSPTSFWKEHAGKNS